MGNNESKILYACKVIGTDYYKALRGFGARLTTLVVDNTCPFGSSMKLYKSEKTAKANSEGNYEIVKVKIEVIDE